MGQQKTCQGVRLREHSGWSSQETDRANGKSGTQTCFHDQMQLQGMHAGCSSASDAATDAPSEPTMVTGTALIGVGGTV